MKRNAEQAEVSFPHPPFSPSFQIQRARVRLHRHGAYDLYNQGTVSFEGRDLFHERPPRPPPLRDEMNGGGERLTSLSDRKEDYGDGDRSETKRSTSAEVSSFVILSLTLPSLSFIEFSSPPIFPSPRRTAEPCFLSSQSARQKSNIRAART